MQLNFEDMEAWADKRLYLATLLRMTVTTYAIKKSTPNILDCFKKLRIVKTFSCSCLHINALSG
jgi:hypothetical protein